MCNSATVAVFQYSAFFFLSLISIIFQYFDFILGIKSNSQRAARFLGDTIQICW